MDFPDHNTRDIEPIARWLRCEAPRELNRLWDHADQVRRESVGDEIFLRGIIEISNICRRDCLYCGINVNVGGLTRYTMTADEIVNSISNFADDDIHTVVLQAGESAHITHQWVAELVGRIASETGLTITLSLGEWRDEIYREWLDAGATRYLLKLETSNPELFARVHPSRKDGWAQRLGAIKRLSKLGYEVGSGGMIGLPGQTYTVLARDILMFRELDIDMIGVGPFVPHPATVLGARLGEFLAPVDQVSPSDLMTLKTLALIRLICPLANIPSTTALATVNPLQGRELALRRGANVIMPDFTPLKYKTLYDIYPRQAGTATDQAMVMQPVRDVVAKVGRSIGKGKGVSLNFSRRNG